MVFNSATVFAHTSYQNQALKTESHSSNELFIIHQSGFSGFSDGFQQNVIDFNFQTNRFFFRYGVNLINPGTHIFTRNTLVGITSSGQEILLNNGSVQGGSLVYDIVHDTYIPNFHQFDSFRIDVSYHDTLWNQQRNAQMIFTLK